MPKLPWTSAAFFLLCLVASSASFAEPRISGGLTIEEAWARAIPPGSQSAAAYIIVSNDGRSPDRLVAVESPIAAGAKLHQTRLEGEVARMDPLPNGVDLPPNSELMMAPGGVHIMLTGLRQGLAEGEKLPLVLTFADGRQARIDADVRQIGARAPDHHHN